MISVFQMLIASLDTWAQTGLFVLSTCQAVATRCSGVLNVFVGAGAGCSLIDA